MLLNSLRLNLILRQSRLLFSSRHKATSGSIDIEKLDTENITDINVIDEEYKERERKLELSRNKSGLKPFDYNRLHGRVPYPLEAAMHWSHRTLKYQQKMYGTYGESSGFDPIYCWPTQQALQCKIAKEAIAYPYTIQQTAQDAKVAREEKERLIWQRQAEVGKRMDKLDAWKHELHAKIAKKEKEALDAKSRKDRLVEDVRRHFGYTVDPKSDKFKEMLEKKEKEQKKIIKEAKRKAKEEKMLGKIAEGLEKPDDKQEKNSTTKKGQILETID